MAYLSPNTSLDTFLKAFGTESQKGIFPHKVTENLSNYVGRHQNLSQYTDNVIQVLRNSPIPTKG
jgi:hypothetical protein